MGALKTRVTTITIVECDEDWVLSRDAEAIERFATAAAALDAVKTRDLLLARVGFNSVTTIEWLTRTHVGRIVVAALQ